VLSASKAWNLAGLKCAAVVTAAPRLAAVTDRFPADTRWRIGHFGAAGSGYARLNFATSPDILDQATARMARSAR
jgi:bifunctional pyridoxal-dependent enzyme with beta-cystathionase and maltose regulon repressor activities